MAAGRKAAEVAETAFMTPTSEADEPCGARRQLLGAVTAGRGAVLEPFVEQVAGLTKALRHGDVLRRRSPVKERGEYAVLDVPGSVLLTDPDRAVLDRGRLDVRRPGGQRLRLACGLD